MIIPCDDIASKLEQRLAQETELLKKQGMMPKLVTVLLGTSPEQLSFVRIKQKKANAIGIDFDFVNMSKVPSFPDFLAFLQKKIHDQTTTGMIVQHPLPVGYDLKKMYAVFPLEKEIEGHLSKTFFQFPLSLSVLTGIKYVFSKDKSPETAIVDYSGDKTFFSKHLSNKNIVIAGKGPTGGKPIARTMDDLGISYTVVDSQTKDSDSIYRTADIIITATGTQVITSAKIRKGVILCNVGLRKEQGLLKGDYDEKEINNKASWYTKTPHGLGPLDVLYLYQNLLSSARLQVNV